jgi:hypothetical protein
MRTPCFPHHKPLSPTASMETSRHPEPGLFPSSFPLDSLPTRLGSVDRRGSRQAAAVPSPAIRERRRAQLSNTKAGSPAYGVSRRGSRRRGKEEELADGSDETEEEEILNDDLEEMKTKSKKTWSPPTRKKETPATRTKSSSVGEEEESSVEEQRLDVRGRARNAPAAVRRRRPAGYALPRARPGADLPAAGSGSLRGGGDALWLRGRCHPRAACRGPTRSAGPTCHSCSSKL